jgi:hypothetical protein
VRVVIEARRYRCVRCEAVLLVVPRGLRARGLYSVAAIGLALALWGLSKATAAEVRRRVNPATGLGDDGGAGWATLRRWARDVGRKQLFPSVPLPVPLTTLRRTAASAAMALSASAAPTTRGLPMEQRAFIGAAHAA